MGNGERRGDGGFGAILRSGTDKGTYYPRRGGDRGCRDIAANGMVEDGEDGLLSKELGVSMGGLGDYVQDIGDMFLDIGDTGNIRRLTYFRLDIDG